MLVRFIPEVHASLSQRTKLIFLILPLETSSYFIFSMTYLREDLRTNSVADLVLELVGKESMISMVQNHHFPL